MAEGGQLGTGVILAYSLNNSPQTWIEIPERLDVTIFNRERDRVETTVHGTTGDRTYIPGLSDVNDLEASLRANLSVGSVHLALKALERSQDTIWVRAEVPDTSNLATTNYFAVQAKARVSRWVLNTPIDDLKTIDIAFQYESDLFDQAPMASQI